VVGAEVEVVSAVVGLGSLNKSINGHRFTSPNAFKTISRRSFLADLYKNPDLHPIIPLVEMIYSRDSNVFYFDPDGASRLLVDPDAPFSLVRVSEKEILLASLCSTWQLAPPCEILGNGAWILRRSKSFLMIQSI
jgi:hypothetical protein